MNRPTLDRSVPCFADLSLNCVIRLASPNPVMQLSTQASCGVLGHLRLHEQRAALRVEPDREQLGRADPGAVPQQRRVVAQR